MLKHATLLLRSLLYALVMASRKLRHYFQGRDIKVITNQPLRKILHKPDLSGRLIKWAVELSQFNISYEPRKAIKAQALSNFIVECSFGNQEHNSPPRQHLALQRGTITRQQRTLTRQRDSLARRRGNLTRQ